jgi:hypothetical protein
MPHDVSWSRIEGRLPGGPGLRLVDLGPDFDPMMELVTGTFTRWAERGVFCPGLTWRTTRAR